MARKRLGAEQIIPKRREAEVDLANGQTVVQVCKKIGVTEQTYYRWRKEYGGLRIDPEQHPPNRPLLYRGRLYIPETCL